MGLEAMDLIITHEVSAEEIDLLRLCRGIGASWFDPPKEVVSLWDRGLVVRDDVKPYTFKTIDVFAYYLDVEDQKQEETESDG